MNERVRLKDPGSGDVPGRTQPRAQRVNVFISHKHENEDCARVVKQVLARYAGSRVDVFLSEEIPPGTEWLPWIREHLEPSNILLLLFTDPTATWDWCLYETGLFSRLEGTHDRRVICIHSTPEPPTPLKHLQCVKATPEKVREFLSLFLGSSQLTNQPPINPSLANDREELTRAASEICDALTKGKVSRRYHNRFLHLTLDEDQLRQLREEERISGEALIASNRQSLEMFALEETPPDKEHWTWEDLASRAHRPEDIPWKQGLAAAIRESSMGRVAVDPIAGSFCSFKTGKTYRPVLHRRDLDFVGRMTFYVLFVEQDCAKMREVPTALGTILNTLGMGSRFRWEIVEPFLGRQRLLNSDSGEIFAVRNLESSLSSIEREAEQCGYLTPTRIKAAFGTADGAKEVAALYEEWFQLRSKLADAIKNRSIGEIVDILESMQGLNKRYMLLASRRYHELIESIY